MLTLQASSDLDEGELTRNLRSVLKAMLRGYRLRVVSIVPELESST